MEKLRQTLWTAQFILCWVLRSWPVAGLPWVAVASAAGSSALFLEVRHSSVPALWLRRQTVRNHWPVLTSYLRLSQRSALERAGKREERGLITSPATSGRVTPPLRVTFQVEPTPSSTALSLTKCPLLAWSLVPIISYSVNSSFIKLCLDYTSFFFPLLQPIKSPVIITMDHWGCFSSWTLS